MVEIDVLKEHPGNTLLNRFQSSSGAVGEAWGLESVPIWVLLDADGRVVEVRLGPQTLSELNELLARASE